MTKRMIDQETREGVRILTVERTEKKNALNTNTLRELKKAFESGDKTTVIRGSGDSFIAGADISEVRSLDREEAYEFAEIGHSVADSIEQYEYPVIAGIDGPCMGGGTELALACDLRYATPRSSFGEPGVKIGVFGGWGGTYRLPRVVGLGDALDLALTGRTVDAEEADEIGLVNSVVEDAEEHAFEIAKEISERRVEAVKSVKESVRNSYSYSKEEAMEREKELFADLFDGGVEELVDNYLEELKGE